MLYANKKGESPGVVSEILAVSKLKLPVTFSEPEIIISLFAIPDSASVILRTCSARITLPLWIPELSIVAIN